MNNYIDYMGEEGLDFRAEEVLCDEDLIPN